MTKLQARNLSLLFMTSLIWGIAFVVQSVAMDYIKPYTYIFSRSIIGGLFLIPFVMIMSKREKNINYESYEKNDTINFKFSKTLFIGGALCGIILFVASAFQQIGILTTTPGKAGFITAFYIIIVPVLGIFLKKKTTIFLWIGVGIALVGLYFLCMSESLAIKTGDILVFICAFIFSLHILVIDYFTVRVDGLKMACIQLWVCGLIGLFMMLIFETPSLKNILMAWKPILYGGMLSSGVAYTFQIIGQKDINPTVASLVLSFESVFAVISGAIILKQIMTSRETIGCVLMFGAIILAQIPSKTKD
ncbi:MAG: DMT family transporter [Fusobacteriaceae bacterium]|jgi:drug/metabolite transporter (DMT)-like permease|nr:DMT family transporter [Fusobacteriaceae bacterium]